MYGKSAGGVALCACVLGTLGLTIVAASGQVLEQPNPPVEAGQPGHHEQPDDAQAAPPDRAAATTPRAVITFGRYTSVQVNVNALGENVSGDAANEPTIAVDPLNNDRIAIGWRQFDTIISNFRQAGRAYTQDGGFTWTFPGVFQPGVFRSDPVLDYDADGRFYYNSLRSDFTCQYFISDDGGQTWSPPVEAFGGDKQWSAIDRTSGVGRGNIYVAWSPAAGCCGNQLFTRSTDGGLNFMNPITLPGSPMWGTLAVAPNGNLFISSRATGGQVSVLRSANAKNAGVTPTFPVVRSVNLGGETRASTQPNPGGLLGQVWIACEPEGGPRPNNVYLLGSVDPPGGDPLDVMFTRSTDGGLTWENPRRVNDDPVFNGAHQWFGTMSVAPNGRIDAVWNDTRGGSSNLSQLYFSTSRDGGVTWAPNEAVTPQFNSSLGYPNQNKLGDYYHSISDNAYIHVAYAATFTGGQDVYYLRIPIDCNENGAEDEDDIAAGTSLDCNTNAIPDECDQDCDESGAADDCEVAAGSAPDCDENAAPDACDIATGRLADCNGTQVPDLCEVAAGTAPDCNGNDVPDGCDITSEFDDDCDGNAVPDACDSAALGQLIQPPAMAVACTDAQAQFTVSAAGATGYQWRFAGADIPQATGAQLLINPVTLADEGEYSCVVAFGCVTAESTPAELRVVPPQVSGELISADFVQVCTQSGTSDAAFVVSLSDADGALYQWSHDGDDLVNSGRISGATGALLNIAGLQPADTGIYTCRAWNICMDEADAVTASAELDVIDPVFSAAPEHACAEIGGTAMFTAAAASSSATPLIYRWYEGEVALSDGGRVSGTTTAALQITGITPSDSGRRFRLRAVVPDPVCMTFSAEALILVQPVGGCTACATPGDFDADGDYDLLDAHGFALCFGADVGARPECSCANVQGSDDLVGIGDWVLLEEILGGPTGQ